jgi:hypothetical protein
MNLGAAKGILLLVAGALITYGIVLTVVPSLPTWFFHAKFTMPKTGWGGVFKVAIAFDLIAAVLAFFVLSKMKAPAVSEEMQVSKVAA